MIRSLAIFFARPISLIENQEEKAVFSGITDGEVKIQMTDESHKRLVVATCNRGLGTCPMPRECNIPFG